MPEDRTVQNLDGSVTLEETQIACEQREDKKRVQIKSIQMGKAKIGDKDTNVNVVNYTDMRGKEEDILRDLLFIDMSTVEGDTATEIALGKKFQTIIDEVKMFVKDKKTKVRVMGKKRVVP